MSIHLFIISPSTTTEQGLSLMVEKPVRHLPALQDGKILGIISIGDVIKSIIADQKIVIGKLEQHILETT